MIFVQRIKAEADTKITGTISTNICTDATNQCQQSSFDFSITLAPAEAKAEPAKVEEKKAEEPKAEEVKTEEPKAEVAVANGAEWMVDGTIKGETLGLVFSHVLTEADLAAKPAMPAITFLSNGQAVEAVALRDSEIDYEGLKAQDTLRIVTNNFKAADLGEDVAKIDGTINYNNTEYSYEISLPSSQEDATKLDWSSLITAILWGFAALLTPCVFPMVPMTVSFFIKGSQSPAQGRFRASMYGFFIVALYVLPIAALILISNLAGGTNVTNDIFNWLSTHWIPNLIFFAIFMIFAASFFGAFEITMPSSLVNKSDAGAEKGGLLGIFFMALTLVLVSFSCTGPIVGTVIISSTSGGSVWMPILTMAAFATAFALPFTLLAWFPSLLKNMPKSGGWLNSVKVVLGFIEIALGLKFLMTADQTYHWGLLDREIYLAIWIVTFALLGLYLLGKLRFAHDDKMETLSVKRLVMAILVFSFVVYLIPGMFGAPLKGISGYLPPMSTQDFRLDGNPKNHNTQVKYGDFLHIPNNLEGYFDLEEAIEAAKEQNKPIFVDVTGHACNNCREMESYVWSDTKVTRLMSEEYIVCALYVDDKTPLAEGDYYTNENGVEMRELGRKNAAIAIDRWGINAQPGYVLLTPDGQNMVSAKTMSYDREISHFVDFLETGLNNHKNGVSFGNGAFSGNVTKK
ncbi:MAG: thioredoxin family protein [Alistipes sp.]|nr:thioredoxin family protein [Alistipes sp.]MBO7264955.1 thioredoxin family protein [Alistipes sp.]